MIVKYNTYLWKERKQKYVVNFMCKHSYNKTVDYSYLIAITLCRIFNKIFHYFPIQGH